MSVIAHIATVAAWATVTAGSLAAQGGDVAARLRPERGAATSRLLDRPARLRVEDESLAEALIRLQRTSGVVVAFSPSLVAGESRATCLCEGLTVGEALDRLLAGRRFRYSEFGHQILIEPALRAAPNDVAEGGTRVRLALLSWAELEAPQPVAAGTLTGQVVDAGTGLPAVGAQVYVPGTSLVTRTDGSGRYALLNVPDGPVRVRVELIGYRPAEQVVTILPGETVSLDFALQNAVIQLEEVIASVEAGEVRRKELGTDIVAIDVAAELATASVATFSDLLNARAANVSITPASGLLGAGAKVRIRGVNSLIQDNNPLIVIDGIRVTNSTDLGPIGTGGQTTSRFNDLNPEEIASLQVIKGPSATALYGSEAAPGVIVITTKKGRAGVSEFQITSRVGVAQNPATFPDTYMDLTPFYGVTELDDPRVAQFRVEQNPLTGHIFVLDNPLEDTDSSPFKNGWFSTHNLSYRGGTEKLTYFTSFDIQDRSGVVEQNDLGRVNWRGNAVLRPHEDVDIAVNAGFVTSDRHFPDDNSIASGIGIGGMLGSPISSYGTDPEKGPGQGICLEDALLEQPNGTSTACPARNGNFGTTFDKVLSVDQGEEISRFTTSMTATWRPLDFLTASLTAGVDDADRHVWDLTPFDPDLPFGAASLGRITDFRSMSRIITADSRATLSLPLSRRISSSTTAGAQYFGTRTESITCSGEDFPSDDVRSCSASQTTRGFAELLENIETGAFLQERLGLDNVLFLTGAIRVDDNSALGERADAIWSPSANASVVLSDMPFWNIEAVNDLRVRFAWGMASQSPGQYQADRTFVSSPVILDGQLFTGITPGDPGNSILGPERSEELELGFDAGLLEDRIGVSFTYFDMRTEDMIVPTPVAPSTGFPGLSYTNLGSMESHGLELSVDASVVRGRDFAWDVRVQHSTVHPLITDLGLPGPIIFPVGADGGSRAAGSQVFQTGFAPGAYISPVIQRATRDAEGNITDFEFAPGNLGDGSNRRVIGQPIPTNQQSLSSTFTFGGATKLFVLFDRAAGHQMLNVTKAFRTPFVDRPNSSSYSREYAFRQVLLTPEEQAMVEQRILAAFIEDADFIKLREITLTHTLAPRFASLFGASRAMLSVGGRNLATWTDFTGIDPEMNVRGARDEFTSNNFGGSFPPLRTFWASLSLTF